MSYLRADDEIFNARRHVTVRRDEPVEGRRKATFVIESWLYTPPSNCSSAIELMPMLTPTRGTRSRCPSRPDTGYTASRDVIDARLHEHLAGAHGFRVLGDERALLRKRGPRQKHDTESRYGQEL